MFFEFLDFGQHRIRIQFGRLPLGGSFGRYQFGFQLCLDLVAFVALAGEDLRKFLHVRGVNRQQVLLLP